MAPSKSMTPALLFMDAKWYLEKYAEKKIHPFRVEVEGLQVIDLVDLERFELSTS